MPCGPQQCRNDIHAHTHTHMNPSHTSFRSAVEAGLSHPVLTSFRPIFPPQASKDTMSRMTTAKYFISHNHFLGQLYSCWEFLQILVCSFVMGDRPTSQALWFIACESADVQLRLWKGERGGDKGTMPEIERSRAWLHHCLRSQPCTNSLDQALHESLLTLICINL